MAAASARPRRRIRASPGSCALPLDIFIEHVLPYIPDATTLLALAATNKALAARVRTRHRVVVDLLLAVGVPAEAAEQDAEGLEHHVSDATLAAFAAFLKSSA